MEGRKGARHDLGESIVIMPKVGCNSRPGAFGADFLSCPECLDLLRYSGLLGQAVVGGIAISVVNCLKLFTENSILGPVVLFGMTKALVFEATRVYMAEQSYSGLHITRPD